MSFVIAIGAREGIAMASDSRLTLTNQKTGDNGTIVQLSVGESDSTYKTFLAPGNIGISTFGAADIQGVPISGFIESLISEKMSGANINPEEIPKALVAFFRKEYPIPETGFIVGAYVDNDGRRDPRVWKISVSSGQVDCISQNIAQGATWGGENDILARLIQPVCLLNSDGKPGQKLPHYVIPWQYYTLQDAIDFAVFAIRSTIDAIRFMPRPKTVGGAIDVLVIKPNSAFWVARKELHV